MQAGVRWACRETNMLNNPRTVKALIIASFALLAVVAVAGWTRKPTASFTPNNFASPNGVYASAHGNLAPTPQAYDQNGRAVYGNEPAYGSNVPAQQPAYSPAYAQQPCLDTAGVQPVQYQSAAYQPRQYEAPVAQTRYRTYSRPRVVRTYVERDRDYVVRKKRTTGKSVAIVAGSAGAGAAIGALAGGGKGAALGALSGGAAGFIYDRLTHNK